MDVSTCVMLVIAAAAIVVFTIAAARDLLMGARIGSTLKTWVRRVADAFFGVP